MQEYTISGTIVTEPISTSSLEAGTVCLVQKDSHYHRVTIQHIDQDGDWYVEGDHTGKISRLRTLFRISILTKESSYPVALREWKTIIRKNLFGERVNATLQPFRFREGKHPQVCTECSSHFLAAKSQPFCKSCCENMSTAVLKKESKPSTNKRPRLLKPSKVKEIGLEAYDLVSVHDIPKEDYEQWLDKKIADASNNDSKA